MFNLPRSWLLALAHLPTRFGLFTSSLEVTRIIVEIPNLPPALDGLCIAHISDMHVGDGMWLPAHVDEAAGVIREEAPDIIINTGDFLQWEPDVARVLPFVAPFASIGARDGRDAAHIAILGNHDYFADRTTIERLIDGLEQLGITVLINEVTHVKRDGAQLSLVGLTHHTDNLERGIHLLETAGRPRLAIIHEPDLAERLPPASADLILAGHTHGGQITLPGLASIIAKKFGETAYSEGFYHVNGMLMYVNRGLGTTGLPLRFRAMPEVTLLRLVR